VKKLAVIGGGAKAAAICAKARCLRNAGRAVTVRVFEQARLGAAWTGRSGYTDGEQRLCTPPERDVGFPYGRGLLNSEGVQRLFQDFSWQSFLVASGGTDHSYRDWVDRGRKPPPHGLYADYVRWVIRQSRFPVTLARVTKLRRKDGKWNVTVVRRRSDEEETFEGYDGVVITGPGPAVQGFTRPDDPRITDGVRFWRGPDGFLAQAEDREEPIVIAGSGGTSAAIAAWIARRNRTGRRIIIIGNQAALFTRTESFFENALFSDEDAWGALDRTVRVSVSQRLNRGVVWASVSDILSGSSDVRFRPGRVNRASVVVDEDTDEERLAVDISDANGEQEVAASLLIDAAGFDPWWFTDLLVPSLAEHAQGSGAVSTKEKREMLAAGMDDDLSIRLGGARLHVPMLSQAQGPGFASLMVLGGMSERILHSYAEPVT
jgi:mycobactin lysine-N-oxygenase